jgi:predicted amidohydrolase YtcJ
VLVQRSRNTLTKFSANSLLFIAVLAGSTVSVPARAEDCREMILYNGKIATMDSRDTMASSVTIDGDRIAAVGIAPGVPKHDGCAKLIDLRGRTVVPGLIDSHNHIVQVSLRPGHDVRIEVAASILEVQQLIHDKATTLPPGQWITADGGWSPEQFAGNSSLRSACRHRPTSMRRR